MKPNVADPRIDRLLFILRWLPTLGALMWYFLMPGAERNSLLLAVAGGGALYNLLALVARWAIPSAWGLYFAIATLALDTLMGVLLFLAAPSPLVLVAGSLFPVLVGWLRFGWRGGLPVMVVLLLADVAAYLLTAEGEPVDIPLYVMGGFVLVVAGLSAWLMDNALRRIGPPLSEVEAEALALQETRKRARLTFEMAERLGATLDPFIVLESALQMASEGMAGKLTDDDRLIGCAMLYDADELVVAAARGMRRQDETVMLLGQEGAVGLALRQREPIPSTNPEDDPELNNFVSFRPCRSLLCVPLYTEQSNFGVMILATKAANMFHQEQAELFNAIGTQATVALQNAMLYTRVQEERDKVVGVDKEARASLARDLHDGPTQTVSAVAMRLNYIRRLLERQPDDVPEELYKLEELTRQAVKEIRGFLFALRPLALESQGLQAALEQLAEKINDTYNQNVIVQVKPDVEDRLTDHAKDTLFNVAIEAVNNARKHANADHIWLRLYTDEQAIAFEVVDDGEGFDMEATMAAYLDRESQSLGMINLRDRAALIDGRLEMRSAPGKGTSVLVHIPTESRHVH